MPKKPVDKIRVPLNVLVAPVTKGSIAGIQNETRESQGEIVDRAVALLALGEAIEPRVRKKNRKEREAEARAAADITAQAVGRADVDYRESAPTTHVASLDAVGPAISGGRGKATVETATPLQKKLSDWRANRKPILRPKEQR
jgi:hypothetical protein